MKCRAALVCARQHPVAISFILSFLLSLIAVLGKPILGRDASLYLTVASQIGSEGLSVAFKLFDWPWLSILFAGANKLTGLDFELLAYLYTIFLMAGTTGLLVSIVGKNDKNAIWYGVLLALSVPAFNEFRYDIIRETGFWFFLVLSLWFYSRATEITWLNGVLLQAVIFAAALFRLEAVFMLAVFPLHILFFSSYTWKEKWILVLRLLSSCVVGAIVILFLSAFADLLSQPRIARSLQLIDPTLVFKSLQKKAEVFAKSALRHWSYADAPLILVSGMSVALFWKLIKIGGLATFSFALPGVRAAAKEIWRKYSVFILAAAIYFSILLVFYIQRGFSNSRYSAFFIIVLIPFFSSILSRYFEGKKKASIIFIVFSILFSLDNVISTSPAKTHYIEAAEWVKNNTNLDANISYMDSRIQYYAGRGFSRNRVLDVDKPDPKTIKQYQYFVVESSLSESELAAGLKKHNLKVEKCFSGKRKGRNVCVLSRLKKQ